MKTRKAYIAPEIMTLSQVVPATLCDGSLTNIPTTEQEGDFEDETVNAKSLYDWELWEVWKDVLGDDWHPYNENEAEA